MKLTKDYIFNHIRTTLYPLWSLYMVQNYKRIPIMHYNGENFEDNETDESKADKSIARLTSALDNYPADALLSIDLKNSKSANGSGVLGPLEFVNRIKEDTADAPTVQQPQGFSGYNFMQPPPGWISEETLNGKLESIAAANERKIQEILFKQKEDNFKEQCRRERQELAELRKELNDERKKYESNTGAAAETLVFAVKKILGELFPNLPFGKATATPQPQLAGTLPDEPPSLPQDPKYKAVERLANFLYDNKDLTEKDITDITAAIESRKAHGEEDVTENG